MQPAVFFSLAWSRFIALICRRPRGREITLGHWTLILDFGGGETSSKEIIWDDALRVQLCTFVLKLVL